MTSSKALELAIFSWVTIIQQEWSENEKAICSPCSDAVGESIRAGSSRG
jgi:hypothetical protein